MYAKHLSDDKPIEQVHASKVPAFKLLQDFKTCMSLHVNVHRQASLAFLVCLQIASHSSWLLRKFRRCLGIPIPGSVTCGERFWRATFSQRPSTPMFSGCLQEANRKQKAPGGKEGLMKYETIVSHVQLAQVFPNQ